MRPDFVLLRAHGNLNVPELPLPKPPLNAGAPIRTVHHPRGKPAVVSPVGRVCRVADEYILHDLSGTEEGSSGAPIFNGSWDLAAIHRGNGPHADKQTSEAVPVSAFWDDVHPAVTSERR